MSNTSEPNNPRAAIWQVVGVGLVLLFGYWFQTAKISDDALQRMLENMRKREGASVAVKDAQPQLVAGRTALNNNDYDLAITSFTEVIRQDPKCAEAYYLRGTAYGKKGDRVRAVADQEEAIRLNPAVAKQDPR